MGRRGDITQRCLVLGAWCWCLGPRGGRECDTVDAWLALPFFLPSFLRMEARVPRGWFFDGGFALESSLQDDGAWSTGSTSSSLVGWILTSCRCIR
ncbi:hypothetical protein BZA05DRAFT_129191 [Tricharina praecox]|uniref:uncharacterized protein n=1 Tax=Tricharina praecox TaxID=43433 RepID=UPI002220751F|nr:uncharacterized protein BZA05DRAFT_129191 [Tricharina praecox]KAI5846878.1 hypothetical protein BZA05DRAFT_129191 [Tricharina praecox]